MNTTSQAQGQEPSKPVHQPFNSSSTGRPLPRDPSLESTVALFSEGYDFIRKRSETLGSDVFLTRLLLQQTICITGLEAAQMFYQSDALIRKGGLPVAAQKTLTGKRAVMLTDGNQHRDRKRMFMGLMTPERLGAIANHFAEEWAQQIPEWQNRGHVLLFDAMQEILCRAVCRWAGISLSEEEVRWRTFELGILIDGAGGVGARHWQARSARKSLEVWLEGLVRQVRAGTVVAPPGTALQVFSFHREAEAGLLDPRLVAVELINILRPTVAVSYFIAFAAKALHEHPGVRERLETDEPAYLDHVIHEVRRMYSFFPFVAARVGRSFTWNGYRFPEGVRVMLDIYGTSNDPRLWERPERFDPDRFDDAAALAQLVPQGAGPYDTTHRCAGEWITMELMRVALLVLTHHLEFHVPPQDLSVNLHRMPMIPASHFRMERVRLKN